MGIPNETPKLPWLPPPEIDYEWARASGNGEVRAAMEQRQILRDDLLRLINPTDQPKATELLDKLEDLIIQSSVDLS